MVYRPQLDPRPHGRLHIGLNPPHSNKRTLRGCCRHRHCDKDGEDGRNIRLFIGAAKHMQGRWSRGGLGGFSPPLLRKMTFYFVLVYGMYKEI